MGRHPHVLVIPLPLQGHVAPLMKLSHKIVDHGIKVTFVNTEFIHAKVTASMARNDTLKLAESILKAMPGHFKDLIEKINQSNDDDQISCIIADTTIGSALEVAEKMGIKRAAFFPAAQEPWPFNFISQTWGSTVLPWSCPGDSKILNHFKLCNWLLCNSFYEYDSPACDLIPGIIPVGPLLLGNQLVSHAESFWPQDSTCLTWLDKQAMGSVIYVAFGSLASFSQKQYFDELALGLELISQPFLWVVRSDITDGPLAEFLHKVLDHPSIACFLSHCGWNSTLEGISMGVPFLCWPYFADQFHNKSYICDAWKIGLGLTPDENGFITRHEIKTKIETLFSDYVIKTIALKLKEMAKKSVTEVGSSFKNFESFIEQVKN
ncbi:hypothetical protein ACB092_04G128900 [Castanea dentata]